MTTYARFVFAVALVCSGTFGLCAQSNYATPYTFANLAGPVPSAADGADGAGSSARFNTPNGVAVDGSGNIYVADTANHTIRKITPTGVVTTLAGTVGLRGSEDGIGGAARFNEPRGVAVDLNGNVYVGDMGNHTIRKITAAGQVTTFAGRAGLPSWVDATGSAARFWSPCGVAVDTGGNVYVADRVNCRIRKITSAGAVTTLAGASGVGSTDGIGSVARFTLPEGVAVDAVGNVYVADTYNYTIRKVTGAGEVTTLAGTPGAGGSTNGMGAAARFSLPRDVTVDAAGNVYVADYSNSIVRKITSEGVVTTLAGVGGFGSQDGAGGQAGFRRPAGVAVNAAGTLYASDSDNGTIRQITGAGVVSTLAGKAPSDGDFSHGVVDGTGSNAKFGPCYGVAVDEAGNVYVADTLNGHIRKVTPGGVVSTLAGARARVVGGVGSSDGPVSLALFYSPYGVAVGADGTVYVADTNNYTIRKISTDGMVSTLAGTAGLKGSLDGTGAAARFTRPYGVAVAGDGTLYVADEDTVRKVTAQGVVTTLAGKGGQTGFVDGTGEAARFQAVSTVAVDRNGNVYVADRNYAGTIRKITSAGVVTTLAGTSQSGTNDGSGSSANFDQPKGIAVDGDGNLYVADTANGTIRMVTSTGVVTTLAGAGGGVGTDLGTGIASRFNTPWGVAVTSSGQVVVADTENYRILSAAPYITNGATASATAGEPFTMTVTAKGLMGSYGASGLPSGLSVDSATGVISGRSMITGTFPVLLSATNVYGQTGSGSLTLTVTTGSQTISFDALGNMTLGDKPFALGAIASSGLPVNYTIVSGPASVDGATVTITGAGTVVVRASQPGNDSFYAAESVERSFTVTVPNVILGNLNAIYDGRSKSVTATTVPSGLNVEFTYNGSASAPKDAGSYTVVGTINDGDYIGSATRTLVISKATLLATVNAVGFIGKSVFPIPLTYGGFADGDDARMLDRLPTLKTNATSKSQPGVYEVTLSGGSDNNYALISVSGQVRLVSYAGRYETMLKATEAGPWIGKVELTMSAGPGYTGKLWLSEQGAPLALRGSLAFSGMSTTATGITQVAGEGLDVYTVELVLPENGSLGVVVKKGDGIVATSADGTKLWMPANPSKVSWAGAYTLLLREVDPLDAEVDGRAYPLGAGYASVKISTAGVMTLAGALPDGTKLTSTVYPDSDTTPGYRLFVQPNAARTESYLSAMFRLVPDPSRSGLVYLPRVAGQDVYWAKAAGATDVNYRAGFGPFGLTMTIDPWTVPNKKVPLARSLLLGDENVFNATYSGVDRVEDDGGVPGTVSLLNGITPVLTGPNPLKWTIKINTTTGTYSGSFVIGDGIDIGGVSATVKRTVSFAGALRQTGEDVIGAGMFLLPAFLTDPTNETVSGEIRFTRP